MLKCVADPVLELESMCVGVGGGKVVLRKITFGKMLASAMEPATTLNPETKRRKIICNSIPFYL